MKDEATTEVGTEEVRRGVGRAPRDIPALVVLWSAHAPRRVGEVFLLPLEGPACLGRGGAAPESGRRALPVRQVPGENRIAGALEDPKLSRRHLRLERTAGGKLLVENLGRRALRYAGQATQQATVGPGATLEIDGRWLFLYTRRPRVLREARGVPVGPQGEPDAAGLVGESPVMWALRERIAFVGARDGHVLITGPSGVGKELVAGAVQAGSRRAGRPLVTRNAATIPETLVDAELFGNVADYPNAGMPQRPGLVGAADGGTLFLDEIGELPQAQQAHLLRVLDAGEYQRLGEASQRTADLRLIAATNRDPATLKPDFLARFRHRLEVPPLQARREDLPLLAQHLLRRAAVDDPELRARFFDADEPRISCALIDLLVQHPLPLQIRELDALLWRALGASRGPRIEPEPGALEDVPDAPASTDPAQLDAATVRAALEAHGWVQEKVWRALGLQSRYVLRRLIQKHALRPEDSS